MMNQILIRLRFGLVFLLLSNGQIDGNFLLVNVETFDSSIATARFNNPSAFRVRRLKNLIRFFMVCQVSHDC